MDPCSTRLSHEGVRDLHCLPAATLLWIPGEPCSVHSHSCATASLKHLIHGRMICCPCILMGVDDLRPIKDKEPALQVYQYFRLLLD